MASVDELASLLGFDADNNDTSLAYGVVTAVDGELLTCNYKGASVSAVKCCNCGVGDVVAIETQNGQARAIAIKGGTRYQTDSDPSTNKSVPTNASSVAKVLMIGGHTEQVEAGKNLFKLKRGSSISSNGITCTSNDDGSYTFNGTATATAYISLYDSEIMLTAGTTYYVSLGRTDIGSATVQLSMKHGSTTKYNYGSFVASGNITTAMLYVQSGVTLNNFTIYPQIEVGSTATSYEPYREAGLFNSPVSAIRNYGKNLLNLSNHTPNTGAIVWNVVNDDGSVTFKGTASSSGYGDIRHSSQTFEAGTYTFSIGGYPINAAIIIGGTTYNLIAGQPKTFTLAQSGTMSRIALAVQNGVAYDMTICPQIERGSVATDFVSYNSNTYTVPSAAIGICPAYGATGNYIDYTAKKYYQYSDADGETLATPVIVDLSSVLDDGLMDVVAGNTLEIVHSGVAGVDVPNSISYIVGAPDCMATKYDLEKMVSDISTAMETMSEASLLGDFADVETATDESEGV